MRLHHVGWVTKSTKVASDRFAREGMTALGHPVPDPVQRVIVQFFVDPVGLIWETVSPLEDVGSSPLSSRLARGGGLDHVCFELDEDDGSLEEVLSRQVDGGGTVVCAPVHAAAFRRRIAFVVHRSGRLLEFVEPRAQSDPY
ncbi:VOC family protein [Gemmatimonas groenlandica]|uniref:VOC domain-containing protein n=1 Tax=Gemmatimonas groenlandica TaxID=2732249 RepID=A0A6M4INC6_9BACT|nr:hypothetical protein HKW67_12135 [Gemmatimonas groenlandica]